MTSAQFRHQILPLKNRLFRFAMSYVANEQDAKDVVQEVMLKTWEEVQNPKSIRNPEAWCMTLTKNKCLDLLKKKGRNYLPISEQYHLNGREADPLQQTADREICRKIKEIIRRLPEKQRDVITLRDMEEYSYKEIAEVLEIDINHVKVLLHRARKKVKEEIMSVTNHNDPYGITKA